MKLADVQDKEENGTYYVKTTVVGNDNYTALEGKVTFDIKKVI